jgi:hypothetical protein
MANSAGTDNKAWAMRKPRENRASGPCPFRICLPLPAIMAPVWGENGLGSFKSIFGVAKAVVPVLYCGYLLYYFVDAGGSEQGIWDIGLGPTVIGLAAVGLLFSIPLILKLVRMFKGPRTPKPGGNTRADDEDDDSGAAADAIIARYLARQAEEAAAPAPRPAPPGGGPQRRPSFGRKT